MLRDNSATHSIGKEYKCISEEESSLIDSSFIVECNQMPTGMSLVDNNSKEQSKPRDEIDLGKLGRNGNRETAAKGGKLSMVFHGDSDNPFDDKQERGLHARRNRAVRIKEKLRQRNDDVERGHFAVDAQYANIRGQWPALFGHLPSKIYVHLDLDSFYASVEVLAKPEYADVPMCVGSKMMVAAANYNARKYGVRAGMPGYKAKQLCPELVFQKPDMKKYKAYSDAVISILSMYDSEVEIYGLDEVCFVFDEIKLAEAYNHYNTDEETGMCILFKALSKSNGLGNEEEARNSTSTPLVYRGFSIVSVANLVEKIRHVVFRNTGLTISAGISVCRGLAKYSSNLRKPNGQYTLEREFDSHILKLPVDKMNGIGKATKEVLEKGLGITTIEDLRSKLYLCAVAFKQKTFSALVRHSYGLSHHDSVDPNVLTRKPALSHGVSLTIPATTSSSDILFYLWNFSGVIYEKINLLKKAITTVTLTIKFASFDTLTKRT
ncbi:DNA polymerase kappa, partial [Pancytospora epiphaga]